MINWEYLIYSLLSAGIGIFLFLDNKKWANKKKKEGISDILYNGDTIFRSWILIALCIFFAVLYGFKFLITL